MYGAGGAPGQSAAGFRRLAVTGYVRTAMVMLSLREVDGGWHDASDRRLAAGTGPLLDAQLKDLRTGFRVRTPHPPRRGEEDRVTSEHETTGAITMRALPLPVAQPPRLDGDPVLLAERPTQDDEVALIHHRSWLLDLRRDGQIADVGARA